MSQHHTNVVINAGRGTLTKGALKRALETLSYSAYNFEQTAAQIKKTEAAFGNLYRNAIRLEPPVDLWDVEPREPKSSKT